MAPAKGAKRAAQANANRAKKVKVTPSVEERMLEDVMHALAGDDGLPQSCREMLHATAPLSLGRPGEERSDCQRRVVEMIGEVISSLRKTKESLVATEGEKVAGVEAQKTELEKARTDAETKLCEQITLATSLTEELAKAEDAETTAKATLLVEEADLRSQDEAKAAAEEKLAATKLVVQQRFAALKEGSWEDEATMSEHISELVGLAGKLNLDEALASSLRSAIAKKPEHRGQFDNMVFEEVEKLLTEELTRLESAFDQAAAAATGQHAKVEAARKEVEVAAVAKKERQAALGAAQEEEGSYRAVKQSASQACKDFASTWKQATKARNQLQAECDLFMQGPLESFEKLRDRSLAPPKETEDGEPASIEPPVVDTSSVGPCEA